MSEKLESGAYRAGCEGERSSEETEVQQRRGNVG